jgi:2,3-dihydroxyphenylpropionate 1,2-dioxygenase
VISAGSLVVSFAPDHHNGFFYDLMPPFCIGYEASGVGHYGTAEGPLSVPTGRAEEPAQWVAERDIDVAISRRMEVDHGAVQPRELLFGGIDTVPTVPVFVNGVAKPFVTMRRVRRLGEVIGGFLAALADERVLVLGSGGLSHDPPVPSGPPPTTPPAPCSSTAGTRRPPHVTPGSDGSSRRRRPSRRAPPRSRIP